MIRIMMIEDDVSGNVHESWCISVHLEAPRCCSLRAKILSILAGFALWAGAAIVALWPRDPSWNLTNLDVLDESALMFFVMAFGSGGLKNDTALPEVIFRAGATLENPNLIGGTAASGDFKVLYKDKLLGGGQSEPVAVPALGSGNVQAGSFFAFFRFFSLGSVCVSSGAHTVCSNIHVYLYLYNYTYT